MEISFPGIHFPLPEKSLKEKAIQCLKNGAAITTLACTIIGGVFLHQYHFGIWYFSTIASTAFTYYKTRSLLKEGQNRFFRTILIISLIGTGSLLFGGSFVVGYQCFNEAQNNLVGLLNCSIQIAFIAGYMTYFGLTLLKGAYSALTDSHWKEKMSAIANLQKNLPKERWIIDDLIWYYLLYCLCRPQEMTEWQQNFQVELPSLEMDIVLSILSNKNKLDTFKTLIKSMYLNSTEPVLSQVKNILNDLNDDDRKEAIQFLFLYSNRLFLTKNQLIELLPTKSLEEVKNFAQNFIDNAEQLNSIDNDCTDLEIALNKIELNGSDESLNESLKTIADSFQALRRKLEKYEVEKKLWLNFINCLDGDLELPLNLNETVAHLENVLKPEFQEKIKSSYQAVMGVDPNARLGNIFLKIGVLNAKFSKIDEEEQAWMFLATHCEFKQEDYAELKSWLQVNEYHEIEEKLEKLGLKSKEDLYKNKILSQDEQLTKEEIKRNLNRFIELNNTSTKKTNFLSSLKELKLLDISRQVSKLFYLLIIKAAVWAPIFLLPNNALIGIGGGTVGYILLKKITKKVDYNLDRIYSILLRLPYLGFIVKGFWQRKFFSISQRTRENMNSYVSSDFFGRLRSLVYDTFPDMLMMSPIGSIFQGMALGREVVGHFEE